MTQPPRRASHRPIALITGASSGIGAAFALALAERGHDLILIGRRREKLADVARRAGGDQGAASEIIVMDLAQRADLERLAERASGEDRLDLLVNNAGFGVPGFLAETDPKEQLAMVDVHVAAALRLTAAALPGMTARGRGGIVNVSSLAAFFPTRGNANYAATKAYLNTFTVALAAELRGTGVRVQALCPGFTRTDFHSRPGFEERPRRSAPEWLWLTAQGVVEASLAGLDRGRVIVIPSRRYRWLVRVLRIPPVRRVVGAVRRRHGNEAAGPART